MNAIHYYRSLGMEKGIEWKNALWMDNVDDSVTIPYSESLDFTGKSFTIAMWVYKTEASSGWEGMVANWNGFSNADQHFSYMLGANGLGANARIRTGGSTQGQWTQSGTSTSGFVLNKWVFRVVQYDRLGLNGPPNWIRFIDSRINSDPNFPQSLPFWSAFNSNIDVLQGYSYSDKVWTINAPIGSFSGSRQKKYIDTIAFYDRALTEREILKLYFKGKGRLPTKIPNCVACYLFDESPGTAIAGSAETPGSSASRIIIDSSGHGNHAYAVGYSPGDKDFVDHFTLT